MSRGKLLALFIFVPLPVVVVGFIVASNEASNYDQLKQGETRRSPQPVAAGALTRFGTSLDNDGAGTVDVNTIDLVGADVQVVRRRVRTDDGEGSNGLQAFRRVEILPGQQRYLEFDFKVPPCSQLARGRTQSITGVRLEFEVERKDQTRTIRMRPPATVRAGSDC